MKSFIFGILDLLQNQTCPVKSILISGFPTIDSLQFEFTYDDDSTECFSFVSSCALPSDGSAPSNGGIS